MQGWPDFVRCRGTDEGVGVAAWLPPSADPPDSFVHIDACCPEGDCGPASCANVGV